MLLSGIIKRKEKVKVTIISGFLGSGKTTLLNNILNKTNNDKIAVFVNDMSSLNIDEKLVKRQSGLDTKDVVELSGGCICCTLRPEFFKTVLEL